MKFNVLNVNFQRHENNLMSNVCIAVLYLSFPPANYNYLKNHGYFIWYLKAAGFYKTLLVASVPIQRK